MLRPIFALLLPVVASAGTVSPALQLLDRFPKKQGYPVAPAAEARDGRIYTIFRETAGPGGIAQLTRGGDLKVLRRFDDTTGFHPSGIVAGENGAVFGSSTRGGEYNRGTIWRYDGIAAKFGRLQDFLIGAEPVLQCLGPGGDLFGTYSGGLFRSTPRGEITGFAEFPAPGSEGSAEMDRPKCLIAASDGLFYGTAQDGGAKSGLFAAGHGALFAVDPSGTVTQVAAFNSETGPAPSVIVEAPIGEGVTAFFGSTVRYDDAGVPLEARVLQITRAGVVSTKHSFAPGTGSGEAMPEILVGSDGALYVFVTNSPEGIFRIDPITGETIHVFTFPGPFDENNANLSFDRKGVLYGAGSITGITIPPRAFRVTGLGLDPVNHPPYARDDSRIIPAEKDRDITIRPLRNDGDVDKGDTLTIVEADAVSGDVVIGENSRTLEYTTAADVTRDVVRYTVVDSAGAEASANVYLATTTGSTTYAGLLRFRGSNNAYVSVLITSGGALTGTLRVAGRRFILKGNLDAEDSYEFRANTEFPRFGEEDEEEPAGSSTKGEIPIAPAWTIDAAELVLTLKQVADGLECDLTFGDEDAGLAEDEKVLAAKAPADGPGRYTLVLPSFDPNAAAPQPEVPDTIESTSALRRRPASLAGDGWAIMAVNKLGTATVIGRLADGKKFSFAGPCASDDSLPFYTFTNTTSRTLPGATLPLPRGILAGSLKFGEAEDFEGTALSGRFAWIRTGLIKDSFARFGLAVSQPVLGYTYEFDPLADAPLTFRAANRKLLVKGEFGPTADLDDIHVDGFAESDGFILPEVGARLGVNNQTGLLTGSFRHLGSQQRYFTSGVIVQSLNQATGMYETPVGTGRFTVKQK